MRPLAIIFAFALVFGGIRWYQDTAHICPAPITYRVGAIDERFAITAEEAKQLALTAEAIWEEPIKRELFKYDESSDFTINFIYDERQQRARTEEEWRLTLDAAEVKNEGLIDEVKRLGALYETAQGAYEEARERYESRLAQYNAEVERFNDLGGAPPDEYARLQREASVIATMLEELLGREAELQKQAEVITVKGEEANRSIARYNAEVLEYNAVFGASETYTQGDFERERINVYKFTDAKELTAVLVHEFGHALGIGHVEDEQSVMYHLLTQRDSLAITTADREAFLAVCGSAPSLAGELRQLIRSVLSYVN